MAEPMIEIPARVALLASKHLYHLAKIMSSHKKELNELSCDLSDAVAGQLCRGELNQALISAKIQEHR